MSRSQPAKAAREILMAARFETLSMKAIGVCPPYRTVGLFGHGSVEMFTKR